MHCSQCDKNFCWNCKQKILTSDPYEHFRQQERAQLNMDSRWYVASKLLRELTPFPSKVCTTYAGVNESARKLVLAQCLTILFSPFVVFLILSRTLWHKSNMEDFGDILIFTIFGVGLINITILGPLTLVLTPILILWTLIMIILTLIQRFKCC